MLRAKRFAKNTQLPIPLRKSSLGVLWQLGGRRMEIETHGVTCKVDTPPLHLLHYHAENSRFWHQGRSSRIGEIWLRKYLPGRGGGALSPGLPRPAGV